MFHAQVNVDSVEIRIANSGIAPTEDQLWSGSAQVPYAIDETLNQSPKPASASHPKP